MDTKSFIKPLIVTTASVATSLGVSTAINAAINKYKPELLDITPAELDKKQFVKDAIKVTAVLVTAGLIAGLAANAVGTAVDGAFWDDDFDVIDSTIE